MESLFTYGTLQLPDVQQYVFGRVVVGELDVLPGFLKAQLERYPIAIPSPNHTIKGMVIQVTADELQQIDFYEGAAYLRVKVILQSGIEAWVYRDNPHSPLSQFIFSE